MRKKAKVYSGLHDIIENHTKRKDISPYTGPQNPESDEYERWKLCEPQLPFDDPFSRDPISYWRSMRERYPRLAQMAFDVLTIPASSADCERMFSELGDLLEPRRMRMKPQLISAIQCTKMWRRKEWARKACRKIDATSSETISPSSELLVAEIFEDQDDE